MTNEELFNWCCKQNCKGNFNCDLCMYEKGRADCLEEMLKLSEEWKNNGGSFLDFQRALRHKLKEQKK